MWLVDMENHPDEDTMRLKHAEVHSWDDLDNTSDVWFQCYSNVLCSSMLHAATNLPLLQ